MKAFHTLIISREPILSAGIKYLLAQQLHHQITHDACDKESAVVVLRQHAINFVVILQDGIKYELWKLSKLITGEYKSIPLICIGRELECEYAAGMLNRGHVAFLSIFDTATELYDAVKTVFNGSVHVSASVSSQFTQFRDLEMSQKLDIKFGLSQRERQVQQLVNEGRCSKVIAEMLNISPKTVETHKYRIKKKVSNKSVD